MADLKQVRRQAIRILGGQGQVPGGGNHEGIHTEDGRHVENWSSGKETCVSLLSPLSSLTYQWGKGHQYRVWGPWGGTMV